LPQIQSATGCDAILFAHVRPFHAYKPLAVGWNLKLVECKTAEIFWSVDEVFDSAEAAVAKAAQDYGRQHFQDWHSSADPASVLDSPRRFSQYTLNTLLGTLPDR